MRDRQRGFTLLELLLAMALTSILLASVAGASLAFMRTASESEVAGRLQRELVFSVEAIEQVLKVAYSVEQPTEGTPLYSVIVPDTATFGPQAEPVTIQLDGTTLTVGSRTVSRRIQSLEITPKEHAGIQTIRLASVAGRTFGQPVELELSVDVVLRNDPVNLGGH